MTKLYDNAVFIGRFQIVTDAHIEIIRRASTIANRVILCLGSSYSAPSIANPFSASLREDMILMTVIAKLGRDVANKIQFVWLKDYLYDDTKWVAYTYKAVNAIISPDERTTLIGHKKDGTSFYLKLFNKWDSTDVEGLGDISATYVRRAMFNGDDLSNQPIHQSTKEFIREFRKNPVFMRVKEEYDAIPSYQKRWGKGPFLTGDAVVVQSGHVLLIQRKDTFGKDLWALPGGFMNPNEVLTDTAVRELREETRLKVPEPVLRGSIRETKVFDKVDRDVRGRVVTSASYFVLPDQTELPKVKAHSDAKQAVWRNLGDVRSEEMFADHFSILSYFTKID